MFFFFRKSRLLARGLRNNRPGGLLGTIAPSYGQYYVGSMVGYYEYRPWFESVYGVYEYLYLVRVPLK